VRALGLALLFTAAVFADVVYVKGGKKIEGRVVDDGDTVAVNIYNSTLPDAKFGRHEFEKARVKKIKLTLPAPWHEFQRRLREATTADECFALAEWCKEQKLKDHRRWALEHACRLDHDHAGARKQLGSLAPRKKWTDRVALAREYIESRDPESVWRKIKPDAKFPFLRVELDRARRSLGQATGYQENRPVALRADKLEDGAKYTLFVPRAYDSEQPDSAAYDPLKPTPLVVGLHGGGPGGADGKSVVGSGVQAMPFYRSHCQRLGWICVCPDALRAGWGGRENDGLMDAILDELCALYNIDENRIYLIGHSMGGGGTWVQGERLAEQWAAIAPAASYGVRGLAKLQKTQTGFYVYHSDDDPRTRVGGVRPRMLSLPGSGADFVYTELSGKGHSFPGHVREAIFKWFLPRTRGAGRGKIKSAVRPLSSFRRKISRDEKKYLPALGGAPGATDSLSPLLKKLKTGGGVAKQVVPKLVAHPDPKTSARVGSILVKATTGSDVRRYAARVLGGRKAKDQAKALGRALSIETDPAALLDILAALGEVDAPEAGGAVLKFLKARVDYLHKRAQSDRLDNTDWSTILPTIARACTLLGGWKTERAGAEIAKHAIERVFLHGLQVIYDRQNQRPLPAARALAGAACDAVAKIGDAAAVSALNRMKKSGQGNGGATVTVVRGYVAIMTGWAKDSAIAAHVADALRRLDNG